MTILIECMYANEKAEQIDLCKQIVTEITKAAESTETGLASKSSKQLGHVTTTAYRLSLNAEQQQHLKQLQSYLKASDLFKKYGLNKTVAYIRDSSLDVAKCKDALVKLTWFASKREKTLHMSEWIDLMKDLQTLQSQIYRSLIEYQDCIEIFLASLLSSRNLDNINLASDWLRDIYNVDKEAAVKLAIQAAQEYFNAASNYLDPDIEFAKACLKLLKVK